MNDQTYIIACNWIDSEISQFDNNPKGYLEAIGWSTENYPKIDLLKNKIYPTRQDIEQLQNIIDSGLKTESSLINIAEGNSTSNFLVNYVSGEITKLYKNL